MIRPAGQLLLGLGYMTSLNDITRDHGLHFGVSSFAKWGCIQKLDKNAFTLLRHAGVSKVLDCPSLCQGPFRLYAPVLKHGWIIPHL
jgi:hypothetical protein